MKAALRHLVTGRTALVIAHRLPTIEDADEIVVLRQGGVLDRTSRRELLERSDGLYRRYAAPSGCSRRVWRQISNEG